MKTFSNSTMKPASLKQRLANAHPSDEQKPVLFLVKTVQSEKTKTNQTGMFWRTNKAAVHASYAIALHVAKTKKPHNIGETLLKTLHIGKCEVGAGRKSISNNETNITV